MSAGRVYYPMCRAVLSCVFDGVDDDGTVHDDDGTVDFGGVPIERAGYAGRPVPVRVTPYEATIDLNSYSEADSWELSFDAKRLPYHPDFLRSVQAEIYLYHRPDLTEDALSPDRRFRGIFDRQDAQRLERDHLAIVGLADEETFELSDDGRTFTCSGLDFTALLTDEWDARRRIAPGTRLDHVVGALVDEGTLASQYGRVITVRWEPYDAGAQAPVVVGVGTKAKGLVFADNKTRWDVIYELCLMHGVIAYVRGFEVVLTTPQDQMDLAGMERRNEALRNRARGTGIVSATAAGVQTRARRVAYGRNLESLSIKRNVGREKTPQILVKCYDPATQQVTAGMYPDDGREASANAKRRTSKKGAGARRTEEQELHTVSGVKSPSQLKEIAETIYNHRSRGESEVEFETRDLTDLDGEDMLRLRPGDPVLVQFDPFNDDEMMRMGEGQRFSHLRGLGYSDEVAGFVAREYDRIDHFKRPYYTRNVRYEWDREDGLGISVTAVNFMRFPREKARKAA